MFCTSHRTRLFFSRLYHVQLLAQAKPATEAGRDDGVGGDIAATPVPSQGKGVLRAHPLEMWMVLQEVRHVCPLNLRSVFRRDV